MNKIEALEWAADYAERNGLFEPIYNKRGYPADGQAAPAPAERAKIISELAEQVADPPAQNVVNLFNPVAMMIEKQVDELRRLRTGLNGATGDGIQEVSDWLEKLAKELRGGADSN